MRPVRLVVLSGVAVLSISALAACGSDGDDQAKADGAATKATIHATDTACDLSSKSFNAGVTTFAVSNKGTKVTEVYIYAPGDKIVSERENIGPGTTAEVTAQLSAGKYQIACKPGMVGKGIRQDITVTGTAGQNADPRLAKA